MDETTIKLTDQQDEAINSDASPIVVRAGAGSGKTAVLVQRYIRLVKERGLKPHQILAVTFTNKAAAEMKERVTAELINNSRQDLIVELNTAPIGTLHSFCADLIRPAAFDIGIDPQFRILTNYESVSLQEEWLTEILDEWRKKYPEKLQTLVRDLHWGGDFATRRGITPASRGFSKQFLRLVEAIRCAGEAVKEPFSVLDADEGTVRNSINDILSRLDALILRIEDGKAQATKDNAVVLWKWLQEISKMEDFNSAKLPDLLAGLVGIPKRGTKIFRELIQALRTDIINPAWDCYYKSMHDSTRAILNELYLAFLERSNDKKRSLGGLDFLDLEEMALTILRDGQSKPDIQVVLIDEAQDLNPIQWDIIHQLATGINLFVVGDAQQSIYGFRFADVSIFSDFALQIDEGHGQMIELAANFRSRQSIIQQVNRLFGKLWKNDCGTPFLNLDAQFQYSPVDNDHVELLIAHSSNRQQARIEEARCLAKRLSELVNDKASTVINKRKEAHAQEMVQPDWSDIVVLVRYGGSFEYLENAFNEYEIPYLIQAGRGFWDALEVNDLISLLRALEDPHDSFSLACILRSPAANFTDDELLELSITTPENEIGKTNQRPIYEGLKTVSAEDTPTTSLKQKATSFLTVFDYLYQVKDRIPLRKLMEYWIADRNLENGWSVSGNGDLILANIRKFLRLCDERATQSVTEIRAAFDEIRLRELHESEAPELSSGHGAVQVMTVHAAKGLEAPIVAIYDMNYQPRNSSGTFIYSKTTGAAFCLNSTAMKDGYYKTSHYNSINEENVRLNDAEEQRILYVAMTRAREKLLLTASATSQENKTPRVTGWLKILTERFRISPEYLFDHSQETRGAVPLLDSNNSETGFQLTRSWQAPSSFFQKKIIIPKPDVVEDLSAINFPVDPEKLMLPVGVTTILKHDTTYPATDLISNKPYISSEDSGLDGFLLGRLIHRLLEIEIECEDRDSWPAIVDQQALYLLGQKPQYGDIERITKYLDGYFSSGLYERIKQPDQVYREVPLLFEVDRRMIKGTIDLALRIHDGWVLVDFKSDRTPPEAGTERASDYENQVRLYSVAWQKLVGELPFEAFLYYFASGEAVPVTLGKSDLITTVNLVKKSNNENTYF